jgi:hypothetical protein
MSDHAAGAASKGKGKKKENKQRLPRGTGKRGRVRQTFTAPLHASSVPGA